MDLALNDRQGLICHKTNQTNMYHRTNVLCCKERSPWKKKYSNSNVREENIAVVFFFSYDHCNSKSSFLFRPSFPFLSVVTVCGGELAVWHMPVIADRSWQTGVGRVGAAGTFNAPVLTTAFNSPKISLLVFLYRDFREQIEYPRMFDVTSETRDNISVIILKSRLTLQVILPARSSLVTPSLIDGSARP